MCAIGSAAAFRGGYALRRLGYRAIAISQLDFERQWLARRFHVLEVAVDVEVGLPLNTSFGFAQIFSMNVRRHDAKGNLAVDAAERQVVDLVAERRNVGPLGGIDVDGQNILAIEIDVRRQVERKRRVAAFVLAETHAVDPDRGGGHHAFEIDEHVLAAASGGQLEAAPIDGDEFVGLVVEAVPGQADIGVGNDDAIEAGIVELAAVGALRERLAVAPVPIDGKDYAPFAAVAAGARPARVRGARVAPAITVLVVFRKSRRSMVVLFVADLSKKARR